MVWQAGGGYEALEIFVRFLRTTGNNSSTIFAGSNCRGLLSTSPRPFRAAAWARSRSAPSWRWKAPSIWGAGRRCGTPAHSSVVTPGANPRLEKWPPRNRTTRSAYRLRRGRARAVCAPPGRLRERPVKARRWAMQRGPPLREWGAWPTPDATWFR